MNFKNKYIPTYNTIKSGEPGIAHVDGNVSNFLKDIKDSWSIKNSSNPCGEVFTNGHTGNEKLWSSVVDSIDGTELVEVVVSPSLSDIFKIKNRGPFLVLDESLSLMIRDAVGRFNDTIDCMTTGGVKFKYSGHSFILKHLNLSPLHISATLELESSGLKSVPSVTGLRINGSVFRDKKGIPVRFVIERLYIKETDGTENVIHVVL